MSEFSLTGRVALITGSGRGIGAGIARVFAGAGAAVAVTARTASEIEAVAAEIEAAGGQACALPADVADLGQLPGLVQQTVEVLGGIDIVVNIAGGGMSPPFLDTRVEHLEAAHHVNVVVPFELSRLAVPHLLERPGASIINMSSIGAGKSVRGHLAHHVAKAALVQLTRSMAADLGPRIRVNALLPGPIETPALRDVLTNRDPALRESIVEHTRMRRMGTTNDVAYAALYLASPAASWVTATLLDVNGGPVDEIISMVPDL